MRKKEEEEEYVTYERETKLHACTREDMRKKEEEENT